MSTQNQPTIHAFESVKQCPKCAVSNARMVQYCSKRENELINRNQDIIEWRPELECLKIECINCKYYWFEHTADHTPTPLTLEEMTAKGIKWPLNTVVSLMPLSKDLETVLSMTRILTLEDLLCATLSDIETQVKSFGYAGMNLDLISNEIQKIIIKSGHMTGE